MFEANLKPKCFKMCKHICALGITYLIGSLILKIYHHNRSEETGVIKSFKSSFIVLYSIVGKEKGLLACS